ncbi:MAG TPA: OsmC family protein [Gemmatimonadales bacterium]
MEQRAFGATLTRDEGFEFSVAFDQNHQPVFAMDEPAPLGAGHGPNATRVLGAAIGHCLSASLLFCLQKARIELEGFEATVRGTVVRNDAGRFRIGRIEVQLTPTLAAGDRDRIARCLELFEDFCIVTESVRAGIDVAVTVAPAFNAAGQPDAALAR